MPWRDPGTLHCPSSLSGAEMQACQEDRMFVWQDLYSSLLTDINCILPSNSLLIRFGVNHGVLLGIRVRLSGLLFPGTFLKYRLEVDKL